MLDFTDSTSLGIVETVCACGMLVSSLILGVKGIKSGYAKILSISLAFMSVTQIEEDGICFSEAELFEKPLDH